MAPAVEGAVPTKEEARRLAETPAGPAEEEAREQRAAESSDKAIEEGTKTGAFDGGSGKSRQGHTRRRRANSPRHNWSEEV